MKKLLFIVFSLIVLNSFSMEQKAPKPAEIQKEYIKLITFYIGLKELLSQAGITQENFRGRTLCKSMFGPLRIHYLKDGEEQTKEYYLKGRTCYEPESVPKNNSAQDDSDDYEITKNS